MLSYAVRSDGHDEAGLDAILGIRLRHLWWYHVLQYSVTFDFLRKPPLLRRPILRRLFVRTLLRSCVEERVSLLAMRDLASVDSAVRRLQIGPIGRDCWPLAFLIWKSSAVGHCRLLESGD